MTNKFIFGIFLLWTFVLKAQNYVGSGIEIDVFGLSILEHLIHGLQPERDSWLLFLDNWKWKL